MSGGFLNHSTIDNTTSHQYVTSYSVALDGAATAVKLSKSPEFKYATKTHKVTTGASKHTRHVNTGKIEDSTISFEFALSQEFFDSGTDIVNWAMACIDGQRGDDANLTIMYHSSDGTQIGAINVVGVIATDMKYGGIDENNGSIPKYTISGSFQRMQPKA